MTTRSNQTWQPFLAVILAMATALAIQLALIDPTMTKVIGLLCANTIVAVVASFVWHRRQWSGSQAIAQFIERTTQLDAGEDDLSQVAMPVLESDELHQPLLKLREKLNESGERVLDAETARASAEIRASRTKDKLDRLEAIMSKLSTPIVAINHFDEIVLANHSAESLLDLELNHTDVRSVNEILHCSELVQILTDTRRRTSNSHRVREIEFFPEDGPPTHYKVACQCIDFGGSQQTERRGAVAVLSDISGEKAIQKRNAEFVAAVSHEMKTPLSGIKAYIELLLDGDAEDEETCEEFLNVINGQADRLQRLIDNMLNLARIEAGVVSVSKRRQSLNEILEEAFSVVEPAAEKKHIALQPELSTMYLGVLADRDLLMQSAINLLSNAIKYTQEGGTVVLRSRLEGDMAVFEVEDNGVGLNEEDCQRVFEKFYRVRQDRNAAPGTGLGLSLVKHIVEDIHGGRLIVSSTVGKGSTFGVQLMNVATLTNPTAQLTNTLR